MCPAADTTSGATLGDVFDRFRGEAVHGECHTGRYRCPYYIWGKGPPILCVPGFMDDAESFILTVARLTEDSTASPIVCRRAKGTERL